MLEYCAAFGLDPDSADPTLATMARWGLWRKTQAARQAFAQMQASDDWAKSTTKDQRALIAWAVKE